MTTEAAVQSGIHACRSQELAEQSEQAISYEMPKEHRRAAVLRATTSYQIPMHDKSRTIG
jgi:hypothetical protein